MKIIKKRKGKDILIEFDSLDDLAGYLSDNKNIMPESHSITYGERESFCKYSYNESINMLENGWIEGISKIDAITQEIEGHGEGEISYIKYDVFGDFLNVGRYLSGEPACAGRFLKRKTKNGEVNILVDCTTPATTNQEYIINRGAAIQAVIDKLLENHYVNLQFMFNAKGLIEGHTLQVIVNCDTRNFYSREAVAFCTSNPAFLRRIFFRLEELLLNSDSCGGYGQTIDLTDSEIKARNIDIYFKSLSDSSKFNSTDAARQEVNRILKEYAPSQDKPEEYSYTPPVKRVAPVAGAYSTR